MREGFEEYRIVRERRLDEEGYDIDKSIVVSRHCCWRSGSNILRYLITYGTIYPAIDKR